MKILPVKSFCLKANSETFSSKAILNENSTKKNSVTKPLSFCGKDLVLSPLQKLKTEVDRFPQDAEYRKELMKSSGLNPKEYYKLRAIIGGTEIQEIMSKYNDFPSAYLTTKQENIDKHLVRANLHMHTLASDGFLPVQELLDKAATYADESVKKYPNLKLSPFTIGITDHDTTESAKDAIKIIAQNPEKYKNLRVILGVEMTTYNDIATNIVDYATNTHTLAYGINPYELKFKNFIDGVKEKKQKIETLMLNDANKIYKKFYGNNDIFNKKEAHNWSNFLKKGLNGIYNYISRFTKTKSMVKEVLLKDENFLKMLKENKISTTTESFMEEMNKFYFLIDKNNKPRKPQDSISIFLAAKTNSPAEEIKSKLENLAQNNEKYSKYTRELQNTLDEYKRTLTPKYYYMPKFEDLYDALSNQKNAIIGIAHPLDTTKKIEPKEKKFEFLKDLYAKFKTSCKEKAKFSEVYYQSYTKQTLTLSKEIDTISFLDKISRTLSIFKTGSVDTHRLNIFKRY